MVGGVCIHTGTIPSKTFREAVLYLTGLRLRGIYGASYSLKDEITMEDLLFRCHHVIRREIDIIGHQMKRNGVTILSGEAAFRSPHELVVRSSQGEQLVQAERIIIAVGTVPAQPQGVEVNGRTIITSDMILELQTLPRAMTVVGAGVIGSEYASIFAPLGVEVTLVDMREELLDFVDREIIESLKYQRRDMNCIFRLGEEVTAIEEEPGKGVLTTLKSGKKIRSDLVLYSVGRQGATESLNLAAAGLKADARGRLKVNENYQAEQEHIYAVGDVIGFPALASTSMEQGRLAACHAFGVPAHSIPNLLPFGIYSIPEISMVGRSEQELTAQGIPYEVGMARYREIARGLILGDDSGLLKLLFHREDRRLLGVHIIGTNATELIHIGQAVLGLGGTIDYLVNTVFNYSTFAECYKVAALDGYNKVGSRAGEAPHPDSGL